MIHHHNLIRHSSSLNLSLLTELQDKPEPFTPGEPLFWDDPHISKGMLAAHLNPAIDLASRRPDTIDRSVAWISEVTGMDSGDAVLDLGCGPGLYASRLAQRGLQVTGVDASQRSIAYAREAAQAQGLKMTYRHENYLTLKDVNGYDAALLIFGDFCPLNPDQRRRLLANVKRALKPGGYFVLDVSTREHRAKYGARNSWYAVAGGFWRPGPHLVLEQGFDYPDQKIWLDQTIVITEGGHLSVYRNWFQDYDRQMITAELAEAGYEVQSVWGDLTGSPLTEDSEWIGIVTKSVA